MAPEEQWDATSKWSDLSLGNILAAALYVVTVLFILGFFWQSIAFLVFQD